MSGRRLWRRSARDVRAELDEEIRFHVERRAAELEAGGLDEASARTEALRQFGDMRETVDVCMHSDLRRERRYRRREWLADVVQDTRLGVRQLARRPGFAALTVLTLGVAIGAAGAIYAVADHVLVRPLPYGEPDRIVTLWEVAQDGERSEVSPANFLDWRERARSLGELGLAEPWSVDLTGSGAPQVMQAWLVTESFLDALGVRPIMGRSFLPEDFVPDYRVALLAHNAWQQRFGGDPAIIGRTLTLDGAGVEIIGILPPGLEYPRREELWLPKTFDAQQRSDRRSAYMFAVARLAPGATLPQAQAEMDGIAAALGGEHVANRGRGVRVVPLTEEVLGEARPVVIALLLATALLLLIACANVANLLVSRGLERGGEMALRGALGAGRARLVRQLLSESLVLSVCAGVIGLLFARWGIQLLVRLAPPDLPRLSAVGLDHRVALFLAALTLVTAALFGSIPALRLSRPDLMSALRAGAARTSQDRLRRALVAGEIAFCFMLLIGAGLLTRSLVLLTRNDLGFETDGRAAAQAFIWDNNPTPEQRVQRVRDILAGMHALPGVRNAAAVTSLPFHPNGITAMGGLLIEGAPPEPDDNGRRVLTTVVTPGYFDVMAIPVVHGRDFTERDGPEAPPAVIINEALARRFFPSSNPIGQRVRGGVMGPPVTREIVGIVADVRQSAYDADPAPELFVPHAQNATGSITFVAHAHGRGEALLEPMRQTIWAVDPAQSIDNEATLASLVSANLAPRTFQLTLTGAFGVMALLLVTLGVYGVVSLWARERRREIGVRLALGAKSGDILRLVLRQGLAVAVPGLIAGAALALVLSRGLESMLYGVRPTDVVTFIYTTLVLLGAAVLAAWLPARSALRHAPVTSIRGE